MHVEGSSSGGKANKSFTFIGGTCTAKNRKMLRTSLYPYRWSSQMRKDWERRRATRNHQHQAFISGTHQHSNRTFLKMKQSLNGLRMGALLQFPTFFNIVKLVSFTFSMTLFKFQLLQITKSSSETRSSVVTQMIFDSADKENQV